MGLTGSSSNPYACGVELGRAIPAADPDARALSDPHIPDDRAEAVALSEKVKWTRAGHVQGKFLIVQPIIQPVIMAAKYTTTLRIVAKCSEIVS